MFDTPEVMQLAQTLARHAGARQTEIAKNVANADTPGYRAKDVIDFVEAFREGGIQLQTTRNGHQLRETSSVHWSSIDAGGEASPNGNTVSLEAEMVRGAKAKSDHDMALTIYKNSMDVLRSALGRGR